jgi:hypothetical protein
MKVTIITNAKAVEKANYILAQATQQLLDNEKARDALKISQLDIHELITFRKQLLKGFLKASK